LTSASKRFTYDRDTGGVSAELCNVLLYPLKSYYLITDTEVTFDISPGNRKKAKSGQTVVDFNSDDVLARRQVARVLPASSATITTSEATAVDREEDGSEVLLGTSFGQVRCLNVQEQTLLTTSSSVDLDTI
jgi:hypothetical protein